MATLPQTILPGLTSTKKERIPAFVDELRRSDVREIAIFPTVLDAAERRDLYDELGAVPGLRIPHVHLRTDFNEAEMALLVERFGTEAFNIHPRKSRHSFGEVPARFSHMVFVENVEVAAEDAEVDALGGFCPDYAHLENARMHGRDRYVSRTERQMRRFPIGCCHVSAMRVGDPNDWSGGWDHHNYRELPELDYVARYADVLPPRWISLELENSLSEQLDAVRHLTGVLLDSRSRSVAEYSQ
jgi:hypothetical protein